MAIRNNVQNVSGTSQLAAEVMDRCRRLASFSEDASGTRRTFLSPPMRDVHRAISGWLALLGVTAEIDAAGNLRALYEAGGSAAPRLLIGSHLDTVPNAGAYDGILGVLLAIALIKGLAGRRLPYAIEIVGFSEEEGVRFGVPFIGSRALTGRLDAKLLDKRDAQGFSVRDAIVEFGLDPHEVAEAHVSNDAFGYVEFHIEQGPVLDTLELPLAVVDAIAGQSRMEVTFIGRANHAGTTPMNLRFDAMAGAAEWIAAVEREAKGTPGLVATVGSVHTQPGATNVVAREARLSLDVRHRDDGVRKQAVQNLTQRAEKIAAMRGLSVSSVAHLDQAAVTMDPVLSDHIEQAIRKSGIKAHRMVSGAGHDAMILAEKVSAGMIFLRTPGGISHDPAESVAVEDVEKAIECGLNLLDQLSASPSVETRMRRV